MSPPGLRRHRRRSSYTIRTSCQRFSGGFHANPEPFHILLVQLGLKTARQCTLYTPTVRPCGLSQTAKQRGV